MQLIRFADADGEIEVDPRFAPLYLTRWRGRLSASVVTALFEFSTEVAAVALAEGTRVAYVNEVDEIARPDAAVRRLISELSVELERSGKRAAMVGSWQVISNPVIRGFLKALGWVTNNAVDGRVAADWADGIAQATAALVAAGQALPPIDAANYGFPEGFPEGFPDARA